MCTRHNLSSTKIRCDRGEGLIYGCKWGNATVMCVLYLIVQYCDKNCTVFKMNVCDKINISKSSDFLALLLPLRCTLSINIQMFYIDSKTMIMTVHQHYRPSIICIQTPNCPSSKKFSPVTPVVSWSLLILS